MVVQLWKERIRNEEYKNSEEDRLLLVPKTGSTVQRTGSRLCLRRKNLHHFESDLQKDLRGEGYVSTENRGCVIFFFINELGHINWSVYMGYFPKEPARRPYVPHMRPAPKARQGTYPLTQLLTIYSTHADNSVVYGKLIKCAPTGCRKLLIRLALLKFWSSWYTDTFVSSCTSAVWSPMFVSCPQYVPAVWQGGCLLLIVSLSYVWL